MIIVPQCIDPLSSPILGAKPMNVGQDCIAGIRKLRGLHRIACTSFLDQLVILHLYRGVT